MKCLILLLVLSIVYVNALKLEKLCLNDVFKFNGQEVNSYYRISNLNATIANSTGHYLLNQTIDYEVDFWFKQRVKRFNGYVEEIFTKKFVEDSSKTRVDIYRDFINGIFTNLAEYRKKVNQNDFPKLIRTLNEVNKTVDFLNHLYQLKKNVLTYQVLSIDGLNKITLPLPLNSQNETLIFNKQLPDYYFNKAILKIDAFEHGTSSNNGTLNFSIYVPVNDKNYQKTKDKFDRDCLKAWRYLTEFYVNKGKQM